MDNYMIFERIYSIATAEQLLGTAKIKNLIKWKDFSLTIISNIKGEFIGIIEMLMIFR
jgi:hypothetical protein